MVIIKNNNNYQLTFGKRNSYLQMYRSFVNSAYEILGNKPYKYQEEAVQLLLKGNDIYVTAPTKSGKTSIPMVFFNLKKNADFSYIDKIVYVAPDSTLSYYSYLNIRQKYQHTLPWLSFAFTNQLYTEGNMENADIIFIGLDYLYNIYHSSNKPQNIANKILGLTLGSLIVFDDIHLINNIEYVSFIVAFRKQMKYLSQFAFFSSFNTLKLYSLLSSFNELILINPEFEDWKYFPVSNTVRSLKKLPKKQLSPDFILQKHYGNSLVVLNSAQEAQDLYLQIKKSNIKPQNLLFFSKLLKISDFKKILKQLNELSSYGYKDRDLLLITDVYTSLSTNLSFGSIFAELTSYTQLMNIFNLAIPKQGGNIFLYLFEPDFSSENYQNTENFKEIEFLSKNIRNEYEDFSLLNEWALSKKLKYRHFNFLNKERVELFEQKLAKIQENNIWDISEFKFLTQDYFVFPPDSNINSNLQNGNFWYLNKHYLKYLLNDFDVRFFTFKYDSADDSIEKLKTVKTISDLNNIKNSDFLVMVSTYPQSFHYSEKIGINNKKIAKPYIFISDYLSIIKKIQQSFVLNLKEPTNTTESCQDECLYKLILKKHKGAFGCIRKKYGYLDFEHLLIHTIKVLGIIKHNNLYMLQLERLKRHIKQQMNDKQYTISKYINSENKDYFFETVSNMFIWYKILQTTNNPHNPEMSSFNEDTWIFGLLISVIIADYKKLQFTLSTHNSLDNDILKYIEQIRISNLQTDFNAFWNKLNRFFKDSEGINDNIPLIWLNYSILSQLA